MKVVLYPSYIFFKELSHEEKSRVWDYFMCMGNDFWFSKFYQNYKQYQDFLRDVRDGVYAGKDFERENIDRTLRKQRMWDGSIHFYNQKKKTLPIGFLPELQQEFQIEEIVDMRKGPIILSLDFDVNAIIKDSNNEFSFRDFQLDNVMLSLTRQLGIFNMAVNAGKTLMFVLASMILRKNNVLILTHSQDIFTTIIKRFSDYVGKTDIGILGKGKEVLSNEITVAMVKTLSNRIDRLHEWFDGVNVVLIDEVHHAPASHYQTILRKCRATVRYGFTGTIPEKKETKYRMMQFVGPVIAKIDSHTLIQRKISAEPRIKIVNVKSNEVYSYEDSIEQNVKYNYDKIHKIVNICRVNKGKKILVIADILSQCRILTNVLDAVGISNLVFYSGTKNRDVELERFTNGDFQVMIATTVMDEGVDIADINTIILAYPRKNYRQIIQRIGRGMRRTEEKKYVDIYDFYDKGDAYLSDHFLKRKKMYDKEKFHYEEVKDMNIDLVDKKLLGTIAKECSNEMIRLLESKGEENENRRGKKRRVRGKKAAAK